MIPLRKFEYFEPSSVEEALSLLSKYGEKMKIIAGGTDLLALMKKRALHCDYIINIKKIPSLSYIKVEEKGLKIGALTTISAIQSSDTVKENYQAIHDATLTFAAAQVRNMATIGGNLCRASPASDMAPPLIILDSRARVIGSEGGKNFPLEQFFKGPGMSSLKPDEILLEILLPPLKPHTGSAFSKIRRTTEDLAKLSVAASLTAKDGVCEDVKIALGSVSATPIRTKKAEDILRGKKIEDPIIEEAAAVAAEQTNPITDVRSTAEYRREVSKILVKRVLKKALERVK